MKEILVHPEQKRGQIFLGNLELDSRETEDFGWVKRKTGLKTIEIGKTSYDDLGEEIEQLDGICDTFGPFPLFIEKSEFVEIKQRDKTLTPLILFERIVKRKTEEEILKERNKEFVGIIQIVDVEPYYTIQSPSDESRPILVESLQILAKLVQKYGMDFENKITFEPPPVEPVHSAEFFRLSPMEKKFFMRQIKEMLKIENGNLN